MHNLRPTIPLHTTRILDLKYALRCLAAPNQMLKYTFIAFSAPNLMLIWFCIQDSWKKMRLKPVFRYELTMWISVCGQWIHNGYLLLVKLVINGGTYGLQIVLFKVSGHQSSEGFLLLNSFNLNYQNFIEFSQTRTSNSSFQIRFFPSLKLHFKCWIRNTN